MTITAMTITPPVRVTEARTHLLWEMRRDDEHHGEPIWACQALCHPGEAFSRFTEPEAPRLDTFELLTPVSCWGCREAARDYVDIAKRVCVPSDPTTPLAWRPPRRVDARPRGDLL